MTTMTASLAAHAELKNPVSDLLQKPLILGASVSADYRTQSPGKRLALRYTKPEYIKTKARSGTPGAELLKDLSEQDLAGRTSIIGIDLFFWDATLTDSSKSEAALNRLVTMAQKLKIPMVLAEVPGLLPSKQPSLLKVNRALEKACADYKDCSLMPLDHLLQKLMTNGYLEFRGRKLTIFEIVPDGLHLSPPASDLLADEMLKLLNTHYKQP